MLGLGGESCGYGGGGTTSGGSSVSSPDPIVVAAAVTCTRAAVRTSCVSAQLLRFSFEPEGISALPNLSTAHQSEIVIGMHTLWQKATAAS